MMSLGKLLTEVLSLSRTVSVGTRAPVTELIDCKHAFEEEWSAETAAMPSRRAAGE
jgi:hypothetical protein